MKNSVLMGVIVALIVGGVIGWAIGSSPASRQVATQQPQVGIGGAPVVEQAVSTKELELRTNMRKLWEDHVTWTRLYLISAMADAEDTDTVTARLLKNQEDIGNAIKPYYGSKAGNNLTMLS